MSVIHVCSLSKLEETVTSSGAARVVSLLSQGTVLTRPASIAADSHLMLSLHDIAEAREGMTPPGRRHVATLLRFCARLGSLGSDGRALLCRHQPFDGQRLHHRRGAGAPTATRRNWRRRCAGFRPLRRPIRG